jgi:hypothetical protein
MGTGYTRNDTSNNIADGNVVNASDLDGEFDAVESAFSTSGHTHDGTAAEGGPVTVVGPAQDVVISGTNVNPKTTNTLDLGTASLKYKDAYIQGNITVGGTVDGRDVATDGTKLDGVEASADVTDTANVTAAGALMDSELTDLAGVKGVTISTLQVKPVEGAFVDGDKTKLDGIESSATADQTDAEIRAAVEAATDSNVFTDADHTKLNGIEAGADVTDTTNVTAAGALMDSELTDLAGVKGVTISTLQEKPSEGAFANGDKTKLDGIEASADVTDATNVTAAGALMDSEVTNLAQVKAFDSADYATAAQGTTADAALPKTGGAMTGAITTNSTFDGRDVATDGTKLDGIEAGADVTDATNVASAGAAMLTGATFTGDINVGTLQITTAGNIALDDNDTIYFGTGNDVEFFCNGSHMYTDLNSGIGNWYVRDGSTTRFTFDDAGSFTATANITAYSDRKLKDNLEVIPNALGKVSQLTGYTYDRIDMDGIRQSGLIAQDVQEVLPEVIVNNVDPDSGEETLSVAYGNIIGLLVEAIKELKVEVEELKGK